MTRSIAVCPKCEMRESAARGVMCDVCTRDFQRDYARIAECPRCTATGSGAVCANCQTTIDRYAAEQSAAALRCIFCSATGIHACPGGVAWRNVSGENSQNTVMRSVGAGDVSADEFNARDWHRFVDGGSTRAGGVIEAAPEACRHEGATVETRNPNPPLSWCPQCGAINRTVDRSGWQLPERAR